MIKKFIKTHEHAWVLVYFVFYMPWYFGLQQRDISHFFDMYVGLDRIIPLYQHLLFLISIGFYLLQELCYSCFSMMQMNSIVAFHF